MKQGSRPIPFVLSHASVLLSICLHQSLVRDRDSSSWRCEIKRGQGSSKVQFRVQILTHFQWTYWCLITSQLHILSSPYPPSSFLSLLYHCCLSNPSPLITDMISAVVAITRDKEEKSASDALWCLCTVTARKKKSESAVRDEWTHIREPFLFMPWRQHDIWLTIIPEATSEWQSGIMTPTDNRGFVDHNEKA